MIEFHIEPIVSNDRLNDLFDISWEDNHPRDFEKILDQSLTYICAFYHGEIIGFVNVAWDGDTHAVLHDLTVHPDYRRQGIAEQLVLAAIDKVKTLPVTYLHTYYEHHLEPLYKKCGFRDIKAGLIKMTNDQ